MKRGRISLQMSTYRSSSMEAVARCGALRLSAPPQYVLEHVASIASVSSCHPASMPGALLFLLAGVPHAVHAVRARECAAP